MPRRSEKSDLQRTRAWMSGESRFLIATAVAHYRNAPELNRPSLVDARQDIVDLFTGSLGYTHVDDLGIDPTRHELTAHVRAFCRSPLRKADDLLAIYIACHGELHDASGEHFLLTGDTDPDDIADALPTEELARKVLLDTPVRRVLLMLDTCHSGRGGHGFTAAALTRMTKHWGSDRDAALIVLTSTQPFEQARADAFPSLFRRAVEGAAVAGHAPVTLALDAVVQAMNDDPTRPGFSTITCTRTHVTGAMPPFLPNPRHDPSTSEIELAVRKTREWQSHAGRSETESRAALLLRAIDGQTSDARWRFTGRRAAVADLTEWLSRPDPATPLRAVTAGPGSGKTAVLGIIAALADDDWRATVPVESLGLPKDASPPAGSVDAVVHARHLTTEQVLRAVAAAARLRVDGPDELLDGLTGRARPFTVIIDALDEAVHPEALVQELLRPLIQHARGRLRLLVGTRPQLLTGLGVRREDSVDLDAPRYADPDALVACAARWLLSAAPDNPYLDQPPPVTHAVARGIATASAPSFLVARITAGSLSKTGFVPDLSDGVWHRSLPRSPGDAIRHDLDTRLGPAATRARDLLRPLAYAEGQGLPWESIWPALASRIAGADYRDEDLFWLRRHAGSYVTEAVDDGHSVYRPHHQAVTEHLREGTDDVAIHYAFVQVLMSQVPLTVGDARDWSRAHPYTLRHLATHAAKCRVLDQVITDAEYLVHALPDELLVAMRSLTTEDSQRIVTVYRASLATHRHLPPAARRQILATDAARCNASHQQHTLASGVDWAPRWATGTQISTALRDTFNGHRGAVTALACSRVDGRTVAISGGEDGAVRVWDLATGAAVTRLSEHLHGVQVIVCVPVNGRPAIVTLGKSRGNPLVEDLTTSTSLYHLAPEGAWVAALTCVATAGGPVALMSVEDGTIRAVDVNTRTLLATLPPWEHPLRAVTHSEVDGRLLVLGLGSTGMITVWDVATGTRIASTSQEDWTAGALACVSVDGRQVAVIACDDGNLRVWDLATGMVRATLAGNLTVYAVACTTVDGRAVAVSGGADATVRVWDLGTGTLRAAATGHQEPVTAIACVTVDGQPTAVTGSEDGSIRTWNLRTLAADQPAVTGHTGDIIDVAWCEVDDQAVAITAAEDATVRIWDLATGAPRGTITGYIGPVSAVACTNVHGRPVAVTAGFDTTVWVWDLLSGMLRCDLSSQESRARQANWVNDVVCTYVDGRPVAVTGSSTVSIWDLTTGTLRGTLTGHDGRVRMMACTAMRGHPALVTTTAEEKLRVWDLTTGASLATVPIGDAWLTALTCTAVDGLPIAVTGAENAAVQVWDLTTGALHATLSGHEDEISAVISTHLDGAPVIITASMDKTVRIWDPLSTDLLTTLHFPSPIRGALCVGPAGEIITGVGWDLTVTDRRSGRRTRHSTSDPGTF
ncbi:hypothetical protein [Actinophytocola sp. NPDC049390]|uniref:hypothetical protein n=1 Tax=Actinophytocola sp. NPDC049390 TaxID=3363894 RepID=UPI0037A48150